jgi:hypothetical protein
MNKTDSRHIKMTDRQRRLLYRIHGKKAREIAYFPIRHSWISR